MIGVNGTLDSSLIPVILVYKVINMDIFFLQKCIALLQKAFINLQSCMDFFENQKMMDVLFWASI